MTQSNTLYISEVEKLCSNQSLDETLLALYKNNNKLLFNQPKTYNEINHYHKNNENIFNNDLKQHKSKFIKHH